MYGSATGNAEEIARQVSTRMAERGVENTLQSLEKRKKVRGLTRRYAVQL